MERPPGADAVSRRAESRDEWLTALTGMFASKEAHRKNSPVGSNDKHVLVHVEVLAVPTADVESA